MSSKTLDNNSRASNPGKLGITRGEYARYRAKNSFHRVVLYLTSYFPIRWQKFRLLDGGFQCQRAREWFVYGNTNPAIVVDAKRKLVAALTDLDLSGRKPYIVVKVFWEKLHLLPVPAFQGQRFAVVSLYGPRQGQRWETFASRVVDCVSTNPAVCAASRERITAADWHELDFCLQQIPQPIRAGQFEVVLPNAAERPV